MINLLLIICGGFYAVLCVFSIVTGLMYASGRKQLNPPETFPISFQSDWWDGRLSGKTEWLRFLPGTVYLQKLLKGSGIFCSLIGLNITVEIAENICYHGTGVKAEPLPRYDFQGDACYFPA